MNPTLALKILEFKETSKIPKLKDVVKQWRRLSLVKHPDKGGSKECFQELVAAYEVAANAAKANKKDDLDLEEEIAHKMYTQFYSHSVKENMQTFTILIEKDLNLAREAILVKNFGSPIDKKICGKKFTFRDKCEGSGVIYITLYYTNKILFHAEDNSHVKDEYLLL